MANNNKSYVPALLLFLLLAHQSLSFPFDLELLFHLPTGPATSLIKNKNVKNGVKLGFKLGKLYHKMRQHNSPPPQISPYGLSLLKHYDSPAPAPETEISPPASAPAAGQEIQGLSLLKQYFYDFGYMDYKNPFTDYVDNDIISALNNYQQFFNLSYDDDTDTINHIIHPRCAVPDLNFSFDLNSENNLSWPKGKWFPGDTKVLTYGFLPDSHIPDNFTTVFRDAFDRWSEAITEMNLTTKLNFTETTYDDAEIKIGFYTFGEMVADVVGGTIMRYDQDNKTVGSMRLDADKYWVLPDFEGTWSPENGEVDLETVAKHQIGHLLGLTHSSNEESVMYPIIMGSQQKVQLTDDDKNSIHQLYTDTSTTSGYGSGRFTLFRSSTLLLLTTLSLRFLLFYYHA